MSDDTDLREYYRKGFRDASGPATLRELSDAATPGPWIAEAGGSEGYYVFGARGIDERHPLRRHRTAAVTWGSFEQDKADATFLVAAVNHVRGVLEDASDYELGATEERARIAWWLRSIVHGPVGANTSEEYLTALTELADVIEEHPERFHEAPPHRPGVGARA